LQIIQHRITATVVNLWIWPADCW